MAGVSAYLNQDTFYEGDNITLNIESTVNGDAKPDLSVLNKDFNILGTSTSSQINIFNGKRSFKKTWSVQLQPKHKGSLQIPAIPVGNEKTQPLKIKVSTLPPEIKAETSKHVFLETSVGINGNETYVQQQIPYMVKLYFDSSMQSGEISQPSVENAVVEELTDGKRYSVIRGGKKFNVVEKHFTISPEKSGKLHIPATTVNGRITIANNQATQQRQRLDNTDTLNKFFGQFGNDPFFNDPFFTDSFGSDFFKRHSAAPSKPFSIQSKAIDVNVLPVPKSFTGSAWLPAEELSIRDSWTRSPPELKVGEPVTRTLVVRAKGLGGSQIPTIDVKKPDGIKIYPGQPTSKTHTDGVTLIGRQYFDVTYIPQKSGKVTIPEIKIDWWNVKTKKQETVTLPAWHLNVAPGVLNDTDSDTQNSSKQESPKAATEKSSALKDNQQDTNNAASDSTSNLWSWKKTALLSLVLMTLIAVFYGAKHYQKGRAPQAKQKNKNADLQALKRKALQACDNNDKQAAAKALLKLAQAHWNNDSIQSLGALISHFGNFSEKEVAAIKELEESLYSPTAQNSQQWKGDKLKAVIKTILENPLTDKSTSTDKATVLKPLYPV